MGKTSRRDFLKRVAAAVPALAVPVPGATAAADAEARPSVPEPLDAPLLAALGRAVLPAELGRSGLERATSSFASWLRGYRPGAELPHGYGSAELRFAPADPSAAWASQLRELDAAARRAHGRGLAAVTRAEAQALVRAALAGDAAPERLPAPARAKHVAIALLAHFYASPEADDLCYGRRIGRQTCRGLGGVRQAPAPTSTTGA
ncbi:MAG TPA: twin-arginine translocation signal domain-containing protein [Longimicrobiales bacterium]|nr:twin-arginine translocation signal domain-containing protein [Longimicrobiales bacterium]